jgi:hypothetical protein
VGLVSMGVGVCGGGGLEDERCRERGEGGCHAGDMTLAQMGKSRFVLRDVQVKRESMASRVMVKGLRTVKGPKTWPS